MQNILKTALDKVNKSWYNIRMKGKDMDVEKLIKQNSTNQGQSSLLKSEIENFAKAVKETVDENFPKLRYPVIAGGAIRSMVFGTPVKDFDIFFDTSSFKPDTFKEDVALLLLAITCENLAKREDYSDLADQDYLKLDHNFVDYEINGQKPFIVYENRRPSKVYVPGQNDFDHVTFTYPRLQFVGHENKALTDNPMTFVENFDWELVKGYFDPMDMNFHFHDDFYKALETNKVTSKSPRTTTRIFASELTNRFEIVEKYDKIRPKFLSVDPETSSATWFSTTTFTNTI